GGTLFLDEIGDLPLELQPKLLRLLQERTYERLGDPEERRADVRVIAATNRNLESEVRQGAFRRDPFERLNCATVSVPPLRERREDIPALLRHALDQTEAGRWVEVAPDAAEYLVTLDFSWPGNVRHLEQLAARLTLEDLGRPWTAADVARVFDRAESRATDPAPLPVPEHPQTIADPVPAALRSGIDLEDGLPAAVSQAERAVLVEALRRYPWMKRSELAARLKISEATLFKKLKQYGLS